jgi:hypothetical protein
MHAGGIVEPQDAFDPGASRGRDAGEAEEVAAFFRVARQYLQTVPTGLGQGIFVGRTAFAEQAEQLHPRHGSGKRGLHVEHAVLEVRGGDEGLEIAAHGGGALKGEASLGVADRLEPRAGHFDLGAHDRLHTDLVQHPAFEAVGLGLYYPGRAEKNGKDWND